MKISYRRVTPGSALSAAMALALMAQGCAPALVQMDKQDLARLKDQGDIHAVHYGPPPKPDCRGRGKATDDIMTTLFGLLFLIPAIGEAMHCSLLASQRYLDVSTLVKDQFVAEASRQLGLQNVRSSRESLSNDDLDSLRQRFGTAMVLDFKVTDWERVVFPADYDGGPVTRYSVPTSMRARLLRLSESRILWQEACNFDVPAPDPSAEEHLRRDVERDAKGCADELVARFLSQEKHAK